MKINPTVVLFSALMTIFGGFLIAATCAQHISIVSLIGLMLVQTVTIFCLYIVVHDCAHRNASKNRLLNDGMMVVCGLVFLLDGFIYRRIHLTHHAHTNEESDPDHFTAGSSLFVRWLKSFFLGAAYYSYAFRNFRSKRWLRLSTQLAFTPTLIAGFCLVFWHVNKLQVFIAGWLLPVFFAMGFLAFVLTAWPHHPAEDTSRIGNAKNLDVPLVLQLLLGNQHLHLVHHYAPTVPWYKLPAYWRENKDQLVAEGAPPVP